MWNEVRGEYRSRWGDIEKVSHTCLYDRIIELDQNARILGAFGEPGHKPGQMAWAHFMAIGPDQAIYVADVLNWRFQVFSRIPSTGKMTTYIPSVRMFWGSVPS